MGGGNIMYKTKRGMVFWFNSQRAYNDDKTYAMVEDYNGYSKRTRLLSGRRPHVVISCDEINMLGSTCTIVPLRSNIDIIAEKYSTVVDINGRASIADVRYITSIDQCELNPSDFIGFISDDELDEIDLNLVKYLTGKTDSKKPSRHTVFMGVDISDEHISSLEDDMVDCMLSEEPVKRTNNKWNLEDAKRFMSDFDSYGVDYIVTAYSLKSRRSVYSTRHNLTKKFGDLLM